MATLSLPARELTLKDHVKARAASMESEQDDRKGEWHEIAMQTGHPAVQFLLATKQGQRRPNKFRLYDSHSVYAFRYLEGGMYSGLSSPNRPWFKFKLNDDDLNEDQGVRIWLDQCEQIVADMLARSNFYRVARANYGELGKFGNASGIMDEDWERGINCTALTIGEYAIGTNWRGEVDTLLRVCPMSTREMVQAFVRQRDGSLDWAKVNATVKTAWDSSSYTQTFNVRHLIEPNVDYNPHGFGHESMPWRSVKWDTGDTRPNALLEVKGYNSKPFWAPRWKVYGNDAWGSGPGSDVLPDMRELQFQAKRKSWAGDMLIKPPTKGPGQAINMQPGAHNAMASVDQGQVEPVYQIPYQAVQLLAQDQQACRQAIDEGTYAQLFMAISEREGVQPLNDLETQLRNDEKMTQLGPVIEGVNTDMLAVAVDRAFDIAMRGDLLPPAPDSIQGHSLDIEFVSVLAQAQKMAGMGQTERALAFIGATAQYQPDVVDIVDGDALARDYWDRAGAPAVGIRDDKAIQDIRQQRQQQQKMAQAAQLAQPAKNGVEAAALLNQIGQGQA